jgi:hypothetical protein
MPEDISDLKERLVAGWERGGRRRRFDVQAKRELVQACLQPGVSVARMALKYGLHANLLRMITCGSRAAALQRAGRSRMRRRRLCRSFESMQQKRWRARTSRGRRV